MSLTELGDDLLIDKNPFDSCLGRTRNERIIVKDGKVRRTVFSVRLFAASEIADWLRTIGFRDIRITDIEGETLTSDPGG